MRVDRPLPEDSHCKRVEDLPSGWSFAHRHRYIRSDGAAVKYFEDEYYSNPDYDPNAHMWSAWEPDPGDSYLGKATTKKGYTSPRRFKTAINAMKAADKAWPLTHKKTDEV